MSSRPRLTSPAPGSCRISRRTARCLWRDDRGVTIALVALVLVALIGFTGLGIETGLWYTIRRVDQSAADAAAISGAMEVFAGNNSTYQSLALYAAENNLTSDPTVSTDCSSPPKNELCVNKPPLLGPNNCTNNPGGCNNYVEAILGEPGTSIFPSVVGFGSAVLIRTRAVAGPQPTNVPTCMLALGTSGEDLHVNGNVGIQLTGCGFFSDSTSSDSILVDGASGFIHTAGTDTVGGDRLNGATNGPPQISPAIQTNVSPAVADPYGSVTFTTPTGTCTPDPNISSGTHTLVAGTAYCSLTISGGTVNIPAGVYYLVGSSSGPGNLTISRGTINGAGVTFVLTAGTGASTVGSVSITGGTGSLTAPLAANSGLLTTAAASTGLLIFQDPTKPASAYSSSGNTITPGCGSSSLTLTGAIDTEKTEDTMQGNPTSCSACLELIANSFHLGGTPLLNINCSGILTASIPGYVIRLVE
jgi:Putative Flp pilus-assembly TadE/G-like